MSTAREFDLEPSNMKRCHQCDELAPQLSQRGRCMSCVEGNYEKVVVLNDSMMSKFAELQMAPVTKQSDWILLDDFVEKELGRPGMVLDVAPIDTFYEVYEEPIDDDLIEDKVLNVPIEQVNKIIEAMKVMGNACFGEEMTFALRLSRYNSVSLGEEVE